MPIDQVTIVQVPELPKHLRNDPAPDQVKRDSNPKPTETKQIRNG